MLNTTLKLNEHSLSQDVETKATRDGFGDALFEEGTNPDVVVLCADLTESVRLNRFAETFPQRFIQIGIAEQNMMSIGAGLALSGKIPVVCSHAIFQPSRNWDQIRLSVCFSNANVKIIGSHSGFSNGRDGGAALSLEDIALLRVLPNLVIFNPLDYYETKKAVKAAISHKGPVYIRLSKEATPVITTTSTPFEISKAQVLAEGTDVSIFATGPIVYEALQAAKELKVKHKLTAEVISFTTIKPLDEKTIVESAKKTGHVVTVEEHQIHGGFGSAVAEVLVQDQPVPTRMVAVNDTFGESGSYQELKDKYGLSAHHIVDKVLEVLKL